MPKPESVVDRPPAITVLAGTNGAGKSSIIGAFIRAHGGTYYNPDEMARALRMRDPAMGVEEANALAWTCGRDGLLDAIATGRDYAFETTLGGRTIAAHLALASRGGCRVTVWYVGLEGVGMHIRRVRERARRGGHDIPEARIRQRYTRSRENLVALMPDLHELRLFDNSHVVDLTAGELPRPRALLRLKAGRVLAIADLRSMPDWAKPLIAAARSVASRA